MPEFYIANGQTYEVGPQSKEQFLLDFPEAKLESEEKKQLEEVVMFDRKTGERYIVPGEDADEFRESFDTISLEEVEKMQKDYEKQKKDQEKRKENQKLKKEEKEEADRIQQKEDQAKNIEKINADFRHEFEQHTPTLTIHRGSKIIKANNWTIEDKIKWLHKNTNKTYEKELSFEEPEVLTRDEKVERAEELESEPGFIGPSAVVENPDTLNMYGVTTIPEKVHVSTLGDDYTTLMNNFESDRKEIVQKFENGEIDKEAAQGALDTLQKNKPSEWEVKPLVITEDTIETLKESQDSPDYANIVGAAVSPAYNVYKLAMAAKEGVKDIFSDDEQEELTLDGKIDKIEREAKSNFTEEELKLYDDSLYNPDNLGLLANSEEKFAKQQEIINNILTARQEKLDLFHNGEIELTTEELGKIATLDPTVIDYVQRFLPSAEEMVAEEDSSLENQQNVINSLNKATNEAVMADPKFQFIQNNILKEVDKDAKAKLDEITKKYKLHENPTQDNLEKAQKEFTDWYNESVGDKLQNNKELKRLYQMYGVATSDSFGKLNQDYLREKDPFLRQIDDTINRFKDDDSWRGELKEWSAKIREAGAALPTKSATWWNEAQISAQQWFTKKRTDEGDMIQKLIDDGLSPTMTVKEARELDPKGKLNRYLNTWRGTRDDDKTLKELLDNKKADIKSVDDSIAEDLGEMLQAYEDSAKYKTYDSGKELFTLEGFLDRVAGFVDQAPHMVPTMIGQGLVTAGGVMTATGVGAPLGGTIAGIGMLSIAVGSMVQGAMEYGGTYMDGVRRQLTEELGREPTVEEYLGALKKEGYSDQTAALTAGAMVVGTEFLSDYITSRLTGSAGGWIAKTGAGKAILGNTFTKYLASVGAGGFGMKLNAYQEYLTEGFQEYLGQVAGNYIDKFTHGKEVDNIFTSNIRVDEIQEAANMGYKQGELFGGVALVSTGVGLNQLQKSYIQQAEDIAHNINMIPGSKTYKAANAAFKKLEQNIRDDKSLSKAEMLKRINELSRIREAAMLTPDNVTGKAKAKLMKLLIEQRQLKNEIKATDNKELSVDKIERKEVVDQAIKDLIKNANQVSESLKGDTVGQSIVPTGSKGKNIDTLAKEYKKNPGSANIESLLNQYQKIALKALGFDSQKGTVKREDAVSFVDKEFGKILESWDPSKGALSTYITATIKPKKSAFYGKEEQLTEKGKSTRLEDTQELQADQDQETQGKEYQEKGSPSSVAAIEETLGHARPNILAKTKQDIKQFIASSLGKVRKIGQKGKTAITKFTPAAVAKSLVNAAKDNKTRALLKKGMGNYTSNKFKKFIEKAINDGLIDIIPFATMKKRFGNVPGFNIDKIGREKGTAAGTGIYKLSGLEKQALIDYYTSPDVHTKKRQKRYNSLVEILAEGMALEQFQEMKTDKDFMNDLSISLKDSGSELTAEQFVDELEKKFDKRTPEKRSLDKIDRFITTKLDPIIDQYKGTFGSLNPAAFAQAFKTGLRAYQKAIKNGLSFAESLQKLINSFVNSFKLNSQQKAAFEKGVFEKIKTEAQLMGKTLIEIMQTSGINVIAKYIEGDVTVNNKNRLARQESVLQSVIKGKIPGQLIKLLRLGYFGRSYENRNGIKYYETINGWVKEGSKKYKQAVKNGTFIAAKGSLYYGVKDPAYVTMMEAANKYNKKKFEKVKRVTIPEGKKLTRADKKANKAQEKINMQALEDFYTILAKRDKNGKLIIPLNDSALLISQSYQGTTGLIKIAAPFAGVSQRLIGGQIEEHSPPASSIGAAMIWGIANNQSELIMQGIRDNYMQVQLSISANNKLNAANLADTIPDGMSILTPNVGILRLAKAGINLNTITDLETGKSLADKAGLPLPNEFKSNPIAVKDQNQLLVDIALKPELTLEKARENLKASELTWNKKTTQVKNNAKNLAPEFLSKDQTTSEQKEDLENSQDTQVNAQKVNKKKKGISVFDLDDTLAKTKEQVLVKMPDGTLRRLTPAQFAEQADILAKQGAEFDFSQFEDVKGAKKGPLADLALRRQDKFGSGDIYVLTARPQTSAANIKLFLDSIGLNIPLKNIIGLENGTSQAKAQWVLAKTKEGYNDFYFADDSKMNVDAVKQILDQVDVKSKVQQAIADKETSLDKEFNEMLEETEGVKAQAEYSRARAKLEGQKKDKGFFKWLGKQLTITPSAEDFLGLMYDLIGSGKQGNRHATWIQDNLIKPYNKAEQSILSAKVAVANDFAALKKVFSSLRSTVKGNPLMDEVGVGPFTKSQAMRVYIWNKQGMEIPGLSQRDQKALVAAVEADSELNVFADEVILIQKDKQYPAPGNDWVSGTIDSDIMSSIDNTFRRKVMTEFNENVKIIFSEKNLLKLEAIYGKKWVDALKDSLRRMQSGSNRPVYQGGGSRIVNEMLDWLNGSVGAVMFINMKSGLLQLISNVNFINWGDNNIYAAAKAFASAEYWPTVIKLMNSDYLVNRRDGLKINVNEAELANAAKDKGMKGAIAYLLDKGFIITRIMDSLAIATGGATFYINRTKALLQRQNPETGKKYTKAEAEAKAFDDFYAISEETQQSSNPSKISQQQASLAGRVILSFQNVTMQYNRKTKKSIRDLYNRRKKPGMTQRESDLSNISSIIYYTTIQNVIFNALQQALFALAFDDETDEEEKNRAANIANGMLDSLLFGLGFGGAAISTVKNVLLKVQYEHGQKSPDYEEAVWEIFNISPVLDSKVRKLRTTARSFSWNMEEIKKRGWSLDNPAYLAISQLISATTNIPIDRVLRKTMNLRAAMDEETRVWQTVALILGWSTWSVGLPYWGLQSTIDQEEIAKEKAKKDYKNDVRKIKAQGYKKVMYRNLKDFDPKDIIELQSPAGTVIYYVKVKKGKQVKN